MNFTPENVREISPCVFYSDDLIPQFDIECVNFLKQKAEHASNRRARLCAHPSPESDHHTMLIAVSKDSLVPPHRHNNKVETMTVIEGQADALFFNELGAVSNYIHMTTPQLGGTFSYYMPTGIYHTIFPRSPWYIFIETTQGPFEDGGLELPGWLPNLSDPETHSKWRENCESAISKLSERSVFPTKE
ncbi:MAG: WbuC family cupin fold metalloprotein [Rhodospirillaceae bacterium]